MAAAHEPSVARVALVSCDAVLQDGVADRDLAPLRRALEDRGATVSLVSWTSAQDWSAFDVAMVRSTWDYTGQLERFLDWAWSTALVTRLRNPLEVLRWNTDKGYLADLERRNVPVVPTVFVGRGGDVVEALSAFPRSAELVVKPAVGAGSRGALRFDASGRWQAAAHLAGITSSGRAAMVQPYLPGVDVDGETAMVHFGGVFSHALRKGPLLPPGGVPVEGRTAQQISAREAEDDELVVAQAALAAAARSLDVTPADLPYARVDVVRDDRGQVRVLELELVEPSLFLDAAPGSAERCAATLLAPLGG